MSIGNKIKSCLSFIFLPWKSDVLKYRFFGTIILILIAIFAIIIFQGVLHYSSTSGFCRLCHSMQYTYEWQKNSTHGSNSLGITVDCVKCHLPPNKGLGIKYFIAKAKSGMSSVYGHIFDPVKSKEDWIERKDKLDERARKHMINESCLSCHKNVAPQSEEGKETHAELDPESDKCVDCHSDTFHPMEKEEE